MPYSRSFRRPASLSQSVVQAGESTVTTRAGAIPSRASAASTSQAITPMAGQPV